MKAQGKNAWWIIAVVVVTMSMANSVPSGIFLVIVAIVGLHWALGRSRMR